MHADNIILDHEIFGNSINNNGLSNRISVLHVNSDAFSVYVNTSIYMKSSLFVLVLNGSANLVINFKDYEAKKEAMVLLSFGHIIRFRQVTEDFECIMLYVSKDYADEMFWTDMIYKRVKYGVKMHNSPILSMKEESARLLEKRLTFIDEVIRPSNHIYHNEMILSTLAVFFMDLGNIIEQESSATDSQNVPINELHFQKFLELLVEHYKKEHLVDFYANKLHITPHYLTQIVKQLCGQTVAEIIFQLLFSDAKVMLQNPGMSIQQIATDLNFSDQSAFGKFFKRKKGMSPKEFRKSV